MDKPDNIDALFDAGRLESIQRFYDLYKKDLDHRRVDDQIAALSSKRQKARARGDLREVRRLAHRIKALEIFKTHGFDPQKLIQPADLKVGYHGKILLVIVGFGRSEKMICLRSGDDWHREILRNTVEEMADLGFEDVSVTPAGGAWVQFNAHGDIIIYGTSDQYGACDNQLAVTLIAKLFPQSKIQIDT